MKIQIALLLLLSACIAKEEANKSSTTLPNPSGTSTTPATPTPTTSESSSHSGGLPFPEKPVLSNPSHPNGATNLPTNPRFTFRFLSVGSKEETAAKIEKDTFFINGNERVASKVLFVDSKEQYPTPLIEISPVSELVQDTWYTLDMALDGSVQIKTPHDGNPHGSATYRAKFFTGSAPQIVEAYLVEKSNTVYMTFSEPVDKKSLMGHVEPSKNGKLIPFCIQGYEGKCLKSDAETWMSETVSLHLDAPTQGPFSLKIDGKVVGSGRTVLEGSKFLDSKLVVEGSLIYHFDHTIHSSNGELLGVLFGE